MITEVWRKSAIIMSMVNVILLPAYTRAASESVQIGLSHGNRPQIDLEQARVELSHSISRVASQAFTGEYGPLLGLVSQPAIYQGLNNFEMFLGNLKANTEIALEELLDRISPQIIGKILRDD